jgi:hypothetical protein
VSLGEEGWSLLWQVVRQMRERAPERFKRFPELTLGLRVVDEPEDDPGLDFDTLLEGDLAADDLDCVDKRAWRLLGGK